MLGPTILDRYVFREIVASFLFSFAVFLVCGLIAGFLPLLRKGMERGLELTLILFQVLISALPSTLVTVLPLSLMIGILLGLGRMAADNEVAAIKSAGIPVVRLLPAVILLGAVGTALSLLCTLWLIPKGISEGKRLTQAALTERVDAAIEERTFFDSLKNLILYVERIDATTGIMSRIFIRESSNPDEVHTILAEKGRSSPDPEGKSFLLNLRNGVILKEDRSGDFSGGLNFESYTFRFPIEHAGLEGGGKTFEEMSIGEIENKVLEITKPKPTDNQEIREYYGRVRKMARILITQRITHPLACLALALAAFPLGVLNVGKSRLNNVSIGLGAIFLYYALTLSVERMARSGLAAPELVLPAPVVLFGILAAYLTACVQREQTPRPAQWLADRIRSLRAYRRASAVRP